MSHSATREGGKIEMHGTRPKKEINKIVPGQKTLYQANQALINSINASMTIIISATNILAFHKVFNDDSLTNTHPLVHLFLLLTKTIVGIITTTLTIRGRPYIT